MIVLDSATLSLLLVAAALLAGDWWRRRHTGPVLHLNRFLFDPEQPVLLAVAGRPAGLWARLAANFRGETKVFLTVTGGAIEVVRLKPGGAKKWFAPLSEVSSSYHGEERAAGLLALALVAFLLEISGSLYLLFRNSPDAYANLARYRELSLPLAVCAVAGLVCFLVYRFSKRIVLSVETNGGETIGISFRRSVVDGATVGINRVAQAAGAVNARILSAKGQLAQVTQLRPASDARAGNPVVAAAITLLAVAMLAPAGLFYLLSLGTVLVVRANVPGARVTVDGGKASGVAGKDGSVRIPGLPAGRRSITIRHDGYRDLVVGREIGWFGSARLEAPLQYSPVEFDLTTTPGAEVYLDQQRLGVADADGRLAQKDLKPGTHRIRVALEGYVSWEQAIQCAPPACAASAVLEMTPEKQQEVARQKAEIERHIRRANELFDGRHYQNALDELDAALSIDPDNEAAKGLHWKIRQILNVLR